MAATPLKRTNMFEVNRTELRQHQSRWLKKARGPRVLLIKSNDPEEEKIVIDKRYFDEIRKKLRGLAETLEIATDQRLFQQVLAAAGTLEQDLRTGKLHSLEDAFAED